MPPELFLPVKVNLLNEEYIATRSKKGLRELDVGDILSSERFTSSPTVFYLVLEPRLEGQTNLKVFSTDLQSTTTINILWRNIQIYKIYKAKI